MKVHKLVVMIVDIEDVGLEGCMEVLENTKYPNRCMYPQVMHSESREIEWHEYHPLNFDATYRAAFANLFYEGPTDAG